MVHHRQQLGHPPPECCCTRRPLGAHHLAAQAAARLCLVQHLPQGCIGTDMDGSSDLNVIPTAVTGAAVPVLQLACQQLANRHLNRHMRGGSVSPWPMHSTHKCQDWAVACMEAPSTKCLSSSTGGCYSASCPQHTLLPIRPAASCSARSLQPAAYTHSTATLPTHHQMPGLPRVSVCLCVPLCTRATHLSLLSCEGRWRLAWRAGPHSQVLPIIILTVIKGGHRGAGRDAGMQLLQGRQGRRRRSSC